jgi:hypothetical protein
MIWPISPPLSHGEFQIPKPNFEKGKKVWQMENSIMKKPLQNNKIHWEYNLLGYPK